MTDTLAQLAKEWGPAAVIAIVLSWRILVVIKRWAARIGEKVGQVVDRHLGAFDTLSERVHKLANKMQEHSEADAEVVQAITRVEGKMDAILDERERTPIEHHGGSRRPKSVPR